MFSSRLALTLFMLIERTGDDLSGLFKAGLYEYLYSERITDE
jgi:hypothetical protein